MGAAGTKEARRFIVPYSPNRAALPFHNSTATDKLLIGGLGSGKTTAGAAEHFKKVCECGPDLLHLVGAPSNKILRYATFPAVLALAKNIERDNGWSPIKRVWDTDQNRSILWWNGSRTLFLTLKDPSAIAGYSTAGTWIDEAALLDDSLAAYNVGVQRRRDPRARSYYGIYTTSPRGPVGIVDHFQRMEAEGDPNYSTHTMTSYDNLRNLPTGYIEGMSLGMSARQVKQDIYGEVVRFEGAIYGEEYSSRPYPEGNILSNWKIGQCRSPQTYVYIDWGPNYPHVLFVEYDPDRDVDVCFDEIVEDNLEHRALIARIGQHLQTNWNLSPKDICQIWCDPNPAAATQELRRVFRSTPVKWLWNEPIIEGIDVVRGRLREHDGTRRLLFASRLLSHTRAERRITQCMALYRWKETATREGLIRLDAPQKARFDHGPDALRYGTVGRYKGKLRLDKRPVG